MKVYENEFIYGKSLLKKILVGAVVSCVIALLSDANKSVQLPFMFLTVALFVTAFVVIYKYCRCSHCGKVVFFGVLAIDRCPKCKRSLTTGKKIKKSKR